MFQCLQKVLQRYKNLYFQIPFYEIHVCFLLQHNLDKKNHRGVIPLNNTDNLFTAR